MYAYQHISMQHIYNQINKIRIKIVCRYVCCVDTFIYALTIWYILMCNMVQIYPDSKLAIGIGHLWSCAGFMVAQIWAINFSKNFELHQYSGDNKEFICYAKCSFKLILPYLVSCYLLMTQLRPLRQPVITF